MTWSTFGLIFLQQCVRALIAFAVFCISTESIFPGFAAPFVNIPVLALMIVMLLFVSASIQQKTVQGSRGLKKMSILGICLMFMASMAYFLMLLSPMGTVSVIRYGATMCAGILLILFAWKQVSSYD